MYPLLQNLNFVSETSFKPCNYYCFSILLHGNSTNFEKINLYLVNTGVVDANVASLDKVQSREVSESACTKYRAIIRVSVRAKANAPPAQRASAVFPGSRVPAPAARGGVVRRGRVCGRRPI